jgi:hypothetical protein
MSCTPAKTKDQINSKTMADTLQGKQDIIGRVVFRIKLSDFYANVDRKEITSIDDFRDYVTASFYEKDGYFYIANRLDNVICKIDWSGRLVGKVNTLSKFDIVDFYISNEGMIYLANTDSGLRIYDKEKRLLVEDKNIISLTNHIPSDNVLIQRKGETDTDFYFADTKKLMGHPFAFKSNYCQHYFNDKILLEMCYEEFTTRELRDRSIYFKEFDLRTLQLVSQNQVVIKCRSCINLPKLLSEKWIVTTNFDDAEKPFNELYFIERNSFKKVKLISPVHSPVIADLDYVYKNNLEFIYYLDQVKNKLYSLCTTEREMVVIEYQLPDH